MKQKRSALSTVIVLAGLLAISPSSWAQAPDKTTAPSAAAAGADTAKQPARGLGMKRLATELKLTEEQKEQLKGFMKTQAEKGKALREDTSLAPAERRAKAKEFREGLTAKLKTVLTPEQFETYKKMVATQVKNRRKNAAGAAGAADAPGDAKPATTAPAPAKDDN